MAVIEFSRVSKSFGGEEVFSEVDLKIEQGTSYGLTGPNGSGKSVLLYLMAGLLSPDSGRVNIDPRYLSGDRTFPDYFGLAINGPAYMAGLTGLQNLTRLAAIRRRADEAECIDALESVGLDPGSKKRVRAYSQGMKQKLALAQAFIESPRVLLLDEPFNALDKNSVERVSVLLRSRSAEGVTIVMTSHHSSEISSICDVTYRIESRTVVLPPSSN